MPEVFVISDTHFGHNNILNFEHKGAPLRPFNSLDEMHATMLKRWNETVSPKDKVYHLGDVAFGQEAIKILGELNGKKRLIRGNHDNLSLNTYRQYFQEVYGVRQINGLWLTHVPIHEGSVEGRRVKGNIHGHIHANEINHPKYFNASVEAIDYRPVSLDEVLEVIRLRGKNV